jgi:hypothetical protein
VPWPPTIGEPLPNADQARGIHEKLAAYCLNVDHTAPVTNVRDNAPFGVLCEVRIPVAGLGAHHDRVASVTTSWELRHADDGPRLVTAYIDG